LTSLACWLMDCPTTQQHHIVAVIPPEFGPNSPTFNLSAFGQQLRVQPPLGALPGQPVLVTVEVPVGTPSFPPAVPTLRRRHAQSPARERPPEPPSEAPPPQHPADISSGLAGSVLESSRHKLRWITLRFHSDEEETRFRLENLQRSWSGHVGGNLVMTMFGMVQFGNPVSRSLLLLLSYLYLACRLFVHSQPPSQRILRLWEASWLFQVCSGTVLLLVLGPRASGEMVPQTVDSADAFEAYGFGVISAIGVFLLISLSLWSDYSVPFTQRLVLTLLAFPAYVYCGIPSPTLHAKVAGLSCTFSVVVGFALSRFHELQLRNAWVGRERLRDSVQMWR